jgi:hypothetical protein
MIITWHQIMAIWLIIISVCWRHHIAHTIQMNMIWPLCSAPACLDWTIQIIIIWDDTIQMIIIWKEVIMMVRGRPQQFHD